jgi:hypothetical protein
MENAVVSVGLNGEGVARGTEEDTRPNPAHRRGGWCGVEAGRRELASAAMAKKKTTHARGLNECKTKQRGGGGPLPATPRRGRGSMGAAETDVGRAVSGAVREQGSGRRAWAMHERLGCD